jgi:glucosylceramidase
MINYKSLWLVACSLWLFLVMLGCKDKEPTPPPPPPPPEEIGQAQLWVTRGDQTQLLSHLGALSIKDHQVATFPVITIDTTGTLQEIEGFGAAMTGSSAYLFKNMNEATRTAALNDLFDTVNGIGISFIRVSIGASDFSSNNYSYDDVPAGETDFDLLNFSLSEDMDDVVPILQEVMQISPNLKILGSPWSPPAWMKTTDNMEGGQLKPECYDVYARYFVKYIQGMESLGIPIYAITPQNEPLYYTANYPCMLMEAADQAEFIKTALGPTFQSQGINSKIICYDHNWDRPDYPITVLNDPGARQYVAGSAFHGYLGQVGAMSTAHFAYPDKALYFTEQSGGNWAPNFSDNLMWYMQNIFIGTVQNWSSAALLWNLCLNQNWGPHNDGCTTCRGVVTYSTVTEKVVKNEEYYAIAHMSKFVRPGAHRLLFEKSQDISNLGISAFLNPDGSKVMVAANYKDADQTICVNQGNKFFNFTVPGKSVVTVTW